MNARSRSATAFVVALTALVIAGLFVPMASGAPPMEFVFVTQPQDATAGDTITASDLNQQATFVQVKLVDGNGDLVTNSNSRVSFELETGAGLASGQLSVTPQSLVDGIATFGEGTLSIETPNEPFFTSYRLRPVSTRGAPITGDPSDAFDIFEDGESCGTGETCDAAIRNENDAYSLFTPGTLGASELSGDVLPGFGCAGQTEIFADSVFVHATTDATTPDTPGPVFLSSHITRREMKAAANNGQAHIDWCVGLKNQSDWSNGATPVQQDTDLDGQLDLWVAFAPACPQANPADSAPCIVSQTGDGNGGNVTTGWLPGGDPPRRT
ncbi:MAG: hypothetical protein ACRELC_10990 [Gemmatimonadota bacterium]